MQEDVALEVERFFGKSPRYEQIQFHCALAALQMGKVRPHSIGVTMVCPLTNYSGEGAGVGKGGGT